MFPLFVFTNVFRQIQSKMDFETLELQHLLREDRERLENEWSVHHDFSSLLYYWHCTILTRKNTSKTENARVLALFRRQYFNEYMYHAAAGRSENAKLFEQLVQQFQETSSAREYNQLFSKLHTIDSDWIGGRSKGVPLVCMQTPRVTDWYKDEVAKVQPKTCLISGEQTTSCVLIHPDLTCPANKVRISVAVQQTDFRNHPEFKAYAENIGLYLLCHRFVGPVLDAFNRVQQQFIDICFQHPVSHWLSCSTESEKCFKEAKAASRLMDEFRLQLCSKEDARRVHAMEEQVKAILQQNERLKADASRQSQMLRQQASTTDNLHAEIRALQAAIEQGRQEYRKSNDAHWQCYNELQQLKRYYRC